jgi:hypothetical protein
MTNETQRELIENEMVSLIGELQQIKGVREALDRQTERKTVGDYIMDGSLRGRYFIPVRKYEFITGDRAGEMETEIGEPYKIIEIFRDGSATMVRTQEASGERSLYFLSKCLNDMEAPLDSDSQ